MTSDQIVCVSPTWELGCVEKGVDVCLLDLHCQVFDTWCLGLNLVDSGHQSENVRSGSASRIRILGLTQNDALTTLGAAPQSNDGSYDCIGESTTTASGSWTYKPVISLRDNCDKCCKCLVNKTQFR